MEKVKEFGADWWDFFKHSPWTVGFATLVFGGFVVFLVAVLPWLVGNHINLTDTCAEKGGVVLKTPDGWACFEDKVRVKA